MKKAGKKKAPDVIAVCVSLATKLNGTVAVEELLEEGGAGQPQPGPSVHAPVRVQ